ncbi:hypothetical protein F5884DRAFT_734879 [Xylogone sp. PMI_703]|nr:hypothetical protein F5884DRAFT_734879 [Xylogone sp. PMI_703]
MPSVYDVVIPTFIKGLKTFDHILTKAEQFAKEKGLDANATYFNARLVEDQNPLVFQIQNATKAVKVNLGRLGIASEAFIDKENTFADLHSRIQEALDLLQSVDPAVVNAQAENEVDLPFGGKVHKVPGRVAALNQGIPNFFFHLNTGYSILRAKGVPLGKADYIGSFLDL